MENESLHLARSSSRISAGKKVWKEENKGNAYSHWSTLPPSLFVNALPLILPRRDPHRERDELVSLVLWNQYICEHSLAGFDCGIGLCKFSRIFESGNRNSFLVQQLVCICGAREKGGPNGPWDIHVQRVADSINRRQIYDPVHEVGFLLLGLRIINASWSMALARTLS